MIGVDISREMISEARKCELERPLGIKYYADDASKYFHGSGFDVVTAQYLFCYADSKEHLLKSGDEFKLDAYFEHSEYVGDSGVTFLSAKPQTSS